jgi:hypothetical protein
VHRPASESFPSGGFLGNHSRALTQSAERYRELSCQKRRGERHRQIRIFLSDRVPKVLDCFQPILDREVAQAAQV